LNLNVPTFIRISNFLPYFIPEDDIPQEVLVEDEKCQDRRASQLAFFHFVYGSVF